ncbi:unnamed protein product, partial [Ceratitis capitata]
HLWDSLEHEIRQRTITSKALLLGIPAETPSGSFKTKTIFDFVLHFKRNSEKECLCSTYLPST